MRDRGLRGVGGIYLNVLEGKVRGPNVGETRTSAEGRPDTILPSLHYSLSPFFSMGAYPFAGFDQGDSVKPQVSGIGRKTNP